MKRAARTKPRKASKARKPAAVLNVRPIGTAVELILRRDADGRVYSHRFKASAKLYATADGRKLVIAPVRVKGNVIED